MEPMGVYHYDAGDKLAEMWPLDVLLAALDELAGTTKHATAE